MEVLRTLAMNLGEFVGNVSIEPYNVNSTGQQELDTPATWVETMQNVVFYVAVVLGIPGNILSAIVWLRRHVTGKNSAAIYLAALAVNDLIFLFIAVLLHILSCDDDSGWLCLCCLYVEHSADTLETLLVLGFSVERLIAVVCPFQVCCIYL